MRNINNPHHQHNNQQCLTIKTLIWSHWRRSYKHSRTGRENEPVFYAKSTMAGGVQLRIVCAGVATMVSLLSLNNDNTFTMVVSYCKKIYIPKQQSTALKE